MERTITLDEIGERSASDLLREIAAAGETLRVALDTGRFLIIAPPRPLPEAIKEKPVLRPLPQFEGTIPAGWKDAIYDFTDTVS